MARFKSIPVVVDAVQWHAGDDIPGVTPRAATIRFSDDRSMFYIEKDDLRPRVWMSTGKQPGEATDAQKQARGLEPATAQIRLTSGEVYCRTVLDFAFWKVPARKHIEEAITVEHVQLLLDYATISGWSEADVTGPARTAYVMDEHNDRRLIFKSSDWIVTDDKGRKRIMDDESFRSEFEPEVTP